MIVKVNQLKCLRCGWTWKPRQEDVRMCPHCKSALWDKTKALAKLEGTK